MLSFIIVLFYILKGISLIYCLKHKSLRRAIPNSWDWSTLITLHCLTGLFTQNTSRLLR